MQNQDQPEGNFANIFIRESATSGAKPFYGDCWPGNSTWIDFLNTNAQEYWGSLFDYSVFKGSNYMYSFWNDMNEPSVFSESTKTVPVTAKHVRSNGEMVEHREFHNAYGAT